jgi:hypothetical protein
MIFYNVRSLTIKLLLFETSKDNIKNQISVVLYHETIVKHDH